MLEEHRLDDKGRPAGGTTTAPGLKIDWQDGPIGPGQEQTGAQVDDLLEAAAGRLRFFQSSPWACDENAQTLAAVEAALAAQRKRRERREARGVEGTHGL